MLRRMAWGLSAALVVALGGTAVAAEPGEEMNLPIDRGNAAFHRWNGGPVERPKPPPPPPADKAVKSRASETAAALRAQEEANLFRRIAACDALKKVALETGDEALERLADELLENAGAAYRQRTANLPGGQALTEGESGSRPAVASNMREGKR
jgi:hypothetical protein